MSRSAGSEGHTRRDRRIAGHRVTAGSLRIVDDGAGAWLLSPAVVPPTKPANSNYVGRVGALAVALGVGGVLVGFPSVAAADTRSGEDSVSQTSGSLNSSAPAVVARESRSRARGAERGAPASRAESEAATAGKRPARDSVQPSIDTATDAETKGSDTAPVVSGTSFSTSAATSATNEAVTAASPKTVPSTAVQSEISAAAVAQSAASSEAIQSAVRAVQPAASAPVATAASAQVVAGTTDTSTALGGDTDPLTALLTPLTWATAAVGRRETTGAAVGRRETTGSATTTTVAAAAAAADADADVLALGLTAEDLDMDMFREVVTQVLTGMDSFLDVITPLFNRESSGNPVHDIVDIVLEAAGQFLTRPEIQQQLGDGVGALITQVAGDPEMRDQITSGLRTALPGLFPDNVPLTDALAAAAGTLLADPQVSAAIAAVADTAVTSFLTHLSIPQVGTVITGAALQIADALTITGADPFAPVQTALDVLAADPVVMAAFNAAMAETTAQVNTLLLGNPLVTKVIGEVTSTVIGATVTGSPEALGQAAVDLIGNAVSDPALANAVEAGLGPVLGPAMAGLLRDPAAMAAVSGAVGLAMNTLLSFPGASDALATVIPALLASSQNGGDPVAALLGALQTSPALLTALAGTVPAVVDSLLSDPTLASAIGGVAQSVVTGFLADSGIQLGFLGDGLGNLASVGIGSLMSNAAIGDLIGNVVMDFLSGSDINAVISGAVQSVLQNSELQGAIGTAVGQALGTTVFGDNIVGDAVGAVAGGLVSVTLGVTAGIALMFTGAGQVSGAAAAIVVAAAAAKASEINAANAVKAAAALVAALGAAASQPAVPDRAFTLLTIQTIVNRFAGFPEPSGYRFTSADEFNIETSMDAALARIDYLADHPTAELKWLGDLWYLLKTSFVSSQPGYTKFSDALRLLASAVNRFLPPFQMIVPLLSTKQFISATLAGVVEVADRNVDGFDSMDGMVDDAIKAGVGKFLFPSTALNVNFATPYADYTPTEWSFICLLGTMIVYNRLRETEQDYWGASPDSEVWAGNDALGVVRGYVLSSDIPPTFTLVGAGNPGTATRWTSKTTNGGIVILEASGKFNYIPTQGVTSDSFKVKVGNSIETVSVSGLKTPATVSGINISKVGTVTGALNIPDADLDYLTYSKGTSPTKGTVKVNDDGTFTYVRDPDLRRSTVAADSFTIKGTDAGGHSVIVATVNVTPRVEGNTEPEVTLVTAPGVGTRSGTTQTTSGKIAWTDADGDALSIAGKTAPTGTGTISLTSAKGGTVTLKGDGTFTYSRTVTDAEAHAAAKLDADHDDAYDTITFRATEAYGGNTALVVDVPVSKKNTYPNSTVTVSGSTTDALGVRRFTLAGTDPDGDGIDFTFLGAGNPSNNVSNADAVAGTASGAIVKLSGSTITYIPTVGVATDSFKVKVTDNHGGSAIATVNLTGLTTPSPVTNIDRSTAGTVTGALNIPDADAGLMTYSVGTDPAKGTVTVKKDGTFTYVRTLSLGHTTVAADTFTIVGTDRDGRTVTIASVDVNPQVVGNRNPKADSVTETGSTFPITNTTNGVVYRQQTTTGKLIATDLDGDDVSFTAGTYDTADGGTVTITANGSYTYVSKKRSEAAWHNEASTNATDDSFTVKITDLYGGSTAATFSIPSRSLNSAPDATLTKNNVTTDAMGVQRFTLSGTDADGDTLAFTFLGAGNPRNVVANDEFVSGTENGAIVKLNGTAITYIPTAGVAADSFKIKVTDGHGGSTVATVSLTGLSTPSPVKNINTATVGKVTGGLDIPPADGGLLTYSLGTGPAKGTVVVYASGGFTYNRTASLGRTKTAADSFTIVGTDADGRSVTVATINVAPMVQGNTAPAGGTVTVGTSALAITGTTSGVQYRQQTTTGTLAAGDADGDSVTFTAGTYTTADGGSVVVTAAGGYTYTSAKRSDATWHAEAIPGSSDDTFTVTVSDAYGGVSDVVFTVPSKSINTVPGSTLTQTGTATDAMGVRRFTIAGTDTDTDTLTYSLAGAGNPTGATATATSTAGGGIVQLNGTSVIYIPTAGVTSDSFKVAINDGHGGTTISTVSLTALSTPSPLKNINTDTIGKVTGGLDIPAADGGLLTYSLGTGPTKGSVSVYASGGFTYRRTAGLDRATNSPPDSFTLIGTDADGRSVTIATVNVVPVVEGNTAPTAAPVTVATSNLVNTSTSGGVKYYTQTTTGTLNAVDAENDPVSFTAGTYTTAKGFSVVVNAAGAFTYTSLARSFTTWHNAAKPGAAPDTFTITVSDPYGGSADLTYGIALEKLNTVPSATLTQSGSATDTLGVRRFTIAGTDDDADTLTYSLAGAGNPTGATATSAATANGGIVQLSGTSVTYIPTAGVTSDSFKVAINDGFGGTTIATVSVSTLTTPSPVKNVSTATAGTVTGALDIPAGDAGLLTYSVGTGPAKGAVTINADGTYTYVRTASLGHTQTPPDSFTIKGTDALGRTVTIATVNVTPVIAGNAAPVAGTVTVSTSSLSGASGSRKQSATGTLSATDADGDAVTFTAGTYTTADGGSVVVTAAGGFTYTSAVRSDALWHAEALPNATGDGFTVAISDAFGGTTTASYVIPSEKLNSAPGSTVTQTGSATDALGVRRFTIAVTDADSDTLTYSLAGAGNPTGATATSTATASGGIVQLSGTSVTYIPTSGVTSDSFKVAITDGYGGTTIATVSVTALTTPSPVKNINTATVGTVTGALDVPTADASLLTYSVGTGPVKGSVTINANGTFSYVRTPDLDRATYTPADSFTITGTDSLGRTVTIATVNVTPLVAGNTAPVAGPVTVTTSTLTVTAGTTRQQSTTGTLGFSDVDGDPVTFTAGTYTTANGGSVVVTAAGGFTYTSAKRADSIWHEAAVPGAPGDTFTVALNDGQGGIANATYSIPLKSINAVPGSTLTQTGASTDALGVGRFTIAGTDTDSDTLTYSLAGAGNPTGATATSSTTASGGIVMLNGTSVTYIPTAGVASDSFKVAISDGHGGSAVATVSLTALTTPSPVKNISTATLGTVTGALDVPAADTGLLTYAVGANPAKGAVTVNADGTFNYVRTASLGHTQSLPDSFTITGTDAAGRTVTIATVNVTPVLANAAPVAGALTVATSALVNTATTNGTKYYTQTTTGTLNASDPDGDALTFAAGTYTTTKGYTVTVTAAGAFNFVTAQRSNPTWHAATQPNYVHDTFTIAVTDAFGGTTNVTYTVPIEGLNEVPSTTITQSGATTDTLGVRRFTIAGSDADATDTLTYSLLGAGNPTGATATSSVTASGGIVQLSGTSVTYIPTAGVTSDSFKVAINDGHGATVISTVSITSLTTPSPVKNISTATLGTVTGALDIPAGDTSLLTYSVGTNPAKGAVTVNADGTFSYVRTAGLAHTATVADSFTITGTDTLGRTVTIATVNVSPVIANAAPVAGTVTVSSSALSGASGSRKQSAAGTLGATDADGDALTFTAGTYTTADGGSVVVTAAGGFTYTSAVRSDALWHAEALPNATGDSFTVSVSDAFGGTTTASYVIPSEKLNTAPGSTVTQTGSATDALGVRRFTIAGTDTDSDTLTFSLAGAGNPTGATATSTATASGGIVTLSGTSVTYIPTAGVTSDSFKVAIDDGHGGTSIATVSVSTLTTPSPVKNISTATAGTVTGALDIPVADAGLLTYSVGANPAKGAVTVNADGTFSYVRTASLGRTTTAADSFTITGTDAAGRSVTIATVNVTPAIVGNAAPVAGAVTVGTSTLTVSGSNRQQNTTGTLGVSDADGDTVTFAAGSYTTANGGTVVVTASGGYTYTSALRADALWHAASVPGAPGDTFTVSVSDVYGGITTATYSIPLNSINAVPGSTVTQTGSATDALGVRRFTIAGTDTDSDTLTYSLLGAGNPTGATATSTVTASGGIVQISGTSVTYIPTAGVASDSFKVAINDGHGGTTVATVSVSSLTTPSPVKNVSTATVGTVTGALDIPAADSGLLTYSVGTGPTKGSVTVNADGTYSYTRSTGLDHSASAADSFTVTGTDALGRTVTIATVNVVPLLPGNSVPVAGAVTVSSSSLTGASGSRKQSTAGTLGASDADGDAVTFTAGTYTTANGGSVVVTAAGGFTYTSAIRSDALWHAAAVPGAAGDSFTVTISDAFGGSTNASYVIPSEKLNTVPGTTVTQTGSATDTLGVRRFTIAGTDTDSDTLTYSLAGAGNPTGATATSTATAGGGIVQLSGTSVTYFPTAGVTSDSFKVAVNDGHGGTSIATVSVSTLTTPSPVKNISTATTGTVTGALDIPAGDAGLLTYSAGPTPAKGAVTVNADGTFTYVRTAGLDRTTVSPPDSFTIIGTDALGRRVTIATVNVIPVVDGNTGPVAAGVTVATSNLVNTSTSGGVKYYTQTTTGTLNATDPQSDPITFTAGTYTTTKGFSVVVNAAGAFTYTSLGRSYSTWHNAAKPGAAPDTFTLTVTDAYGGSSELTYGIALESLNEIPSTTLTQSGATTDTLGVRRFTIVGTDADADTLTYSLAGAGNPTGATATSTVTANGGIVTLSVDAVTYIPTAGVTSDSFKVAINDGRGATVIATVSLTTLTTPSPVKNVSTATVGTVTGALDIPAADAGLLTTYSLGTGPAKGTVTVNADGTYSYTRTTAGHTGGAADSFTIRGTDAAGRSVTIATINVTPVLVNAAPAAGPVTVTSSSLAVSSTQSGVEYRKQNTAGTLGTTDADSDAVTFTAGTYTTAKGGSVVVTAAGGFTYTSAERSNAVWHATTAADTDTFTVTVADGFGGSTAATYAIPGTPLTANNVPSSTLSYSAIATDALGLRRWTMTGTDADGDTLTYSLAATGNPTGATATGTLSANGALVQLSGNAIIYVPKVGVASDSFKVLVSDGYGGSAIATVTLSSMTTPSPVKNINDSIDNVVSGALDVPAGDVGLFTYGVGSTGPVNGSVTVNADGTFVYTRTAGLSTSVAAADSFTIKATDAAGRSVTMATVNVTPDLGNEAPVLVINTAPTVGTRTGNVQTTTGKITWSDEENDPLTINGIAVPTGTNTISLTTTNGGTVVLKGDGTFTYTRTYTDAVAHAAAKIGAVDSAKNDYLNITLADPAGLSNTYAIQVPVYAVSNAPVITGGTRTVLSGTVSAITVTDADGDTTPTMTFTASSGTFTFNGLGVNTSKITGGSTLSTITLTVKDGYYTVTNGVVSATQVSVSKSWS